MKKDALVEEWVDGYGGWFLKEGALDKARMTKTLYLPVSASWNPSFYIPAIPRAPLSDRKLKKIVKNMGQGAIDGKTAGLDGVYLHGHGAEGFGPPS